MSISYIWGGGSAGEIATENDNSIVTFKFEDVLLMSVQIII